jgi:putative endonuclease
VDRNFRSRGGEIDLIMRDGRTLVFVEVRYRRDAAFGGAVASVDPRKQRKLRAAARAYIQRHPGCAREPMRFDIVGIEGDGAEPQWLQDAL